MRLLLFISMTLTAMCCFTSYVECAEPIELRTSTGTIYGTLETPGTAHPMPVTLIIPGSGPTDRDGNNVIAGRNDSLKLLAQGLASKGIASVRYDKRGVGESINAGAKEDDLRFESYIDDAVLWGKLLRQDERFNRLVIIGHSEGALIGMVACRRLGADGFVSIAGSGQPAAELIEKQLERNAPTVILLESRNILERLKRGETVGAVSPGLVPLFRPSVQPYLISWFRYDPVHEISRLDVPVMIVQGSTDMQVSVSDAERLYQANNKARVVILDGMNHVLKKVPDDVNRQTASYNDPTLQIVPELIEKIAEFFKELD